MRITDRITKIEQECERIIKRLRSLPEGTAYVYENRGCCGFRGQLNGKRHYYNKSEQSLAETLIVKQYLSLKLGDLQARKKHLLACNSLKIHLTSKANDFLLTHPLNAKIISRYLHEAATAPVKAYDEAPYQEKRTEEAVLGLRVRSKSEVMIAGMLYEHGLPFTYEEPLRLGTEVYYPDFTIHLPCESSVFWYEHFGRMDNENYMRKAYAKLTNYAMYGIVPNVNLVTTYETGDSPLRLSQIERAIETIEQWIR